MFHKILLPLDGSNLSERALPHALQLARASHAELNLMRVALPMPVTIPTTVGEVGIMYADQVTDQTLQNVHSYLDQLEQRYQSPDLRLQCHATQGDVASGILNAAEQLPADLILMSTHGYSGLTRWLLGSITEKVLQNATCPVIAVRNVEPITTILVALDGSPRAESVLAPTLELARLFNAHVIFFHAVEPAVEPDNRLLETTEPNLWQRLQDWSYEQGRRYLEEVAEAYGPSVPSYETDLSFAPAPEAILDAARAYHADLIALATHGRTGFSRWLYGSVTEKVLRHTDRNLLVVRNNTN